MAAALAMFAGPVHAAAAGAKQTILRALSCSFHHSRGNLDARKKQPPATSIEHTPTVIASGRGSPSPAMARVHWSMSAPNFPLILSMVRSYTRDS